MDKKIIARMLSDCVLVAGVINSLRLAESAGWCTIFLSPAVSIGDMIAVAQRENADAATPARAVTSGLVDAPR